MTPGEVADRACPERRRSSHGGRQIAPREGRRPCDITRRCRRRGSSAPSGWRTANASGERSMILPVPNGPRSRIVTVTERPVSRSVTVTSVPNGSVGCAAVRPDHGGSYHVASPVWVSPIAPGTSVVPRTWTAGPTGAPRLPARARSTARSAAGSRLAVDDRHEEGADGGRHAPVDHLTVPGTSSAVNSVCTSNGIVTRCMRVTTRTSSKCISRAVVEGGAGRWQDAVVSVGLDPHGREEPLGRARVGQDIAHLPSTTTCTARPGTIRRSKESRSRRVGPPRRRPVPSCHHPDPRIGGASNSAASEARNASAPTRCVAGAPPRSSAIALVGDGCTRIAEASVMPSSRSRSCTESEVVATVSLALVDDEVDVLAHGQVHNPATRDTPTTRAAPMTTRWARSR